MYFAEVSGLSLRTIQRIGKTGSASQKTVKSLCAILVLKVDNLCLPERTE